MNERFEERVRKGGQVLIGFLGLFMVVNAFLARAQESDIVWVPNMVGEGAAEAGKLEEAQLLARARVYAAALKRAGVEYQPELLGTLASMMRGPEDRRRSNDAFVSLLRMGSRGFVSNLRNVRWSTGGGAVSPTDIQQVTARLLCDVKVVRSKGNTDPTFFVTLSFDQDVFREGEQIGIKIVSSQECYLSVYQIAGDSVRLLFPRDGSGDTPFMADQVLRLPYSIEPWEAVLPEGWDTAEDLILVVARRDQPALQSNGGSTEDRYATIREAFLTEILGELLSVAPGRRAIAVGRLSLTRN
jgi:hypothetical protein